MTKSQVFRDRFFDWLDVHPWVATMVIVIVMLTASLVYSVVVPIGLLLYGVGRIGRTMLDFVGIRLR